MNASIITESSRSILKGFSMLLPARHSMEFSTRTAELILTRIINSNESQDRGLPEPLRTKRG